MAKIKKDIYLEKERINLSLSRKNHEELKIITLQKKKYEVKIDEKMHLSGHRLCKYLMILGLEVLQQKHGQINKIFKNEGLLDEK